jgi:hypothetical protein
LSGEYQSGSLDVRRALSSLEVSLTLLHSEPSITWCAGCTDWHDNSASPSQGAGSLPGISGPLDARSRRLSAAHLAVCRRLARLGHSASVIFGPLSAVLIAKLGLGPGPPRRRACPDKSVMAFAGGSSARLPRGCAARSGPAGLGLSFWKAGLAEQPNPRWRHRADPGPLELEPRRPGTRDYPGHWRSQQANQVIACCVRPVVTAGSPILPGARVN